MGSIWSEIGETFTVLSGLAPKRFRQVHHWKESPIQMTSGTNGKPSWQNSSASLQIPVHHRGVTHHPIAYGRNTHNPGERVQ